jgi:hypothetical protein
MELYDCEQRLDDKAMFGTVPSQDAVDLTLENGIAGTLSDLDCDLVSDDLCYDLRLQVQEDPTNSELVQVYRDRCDVDYDPAFNNSTKPDDGANADGTDLPLCEREPDNPECKDPDQNDTTTGDAVVHECKPLLSQVANADSFSLQTVRDTYWQFAQCTGEYDPCARVDWFGGDDRWRAYQTCLFDVFPEHHVGYCELIQQLLDMTDGDQHRMAEEEFVTAECGSI